MRNPANMLMPAPYDTAWTTLHEQFNARPAPGSIAPPPAAANGAVGALASGASGAGSSGQALPLNTCRSCLIIQNNSAPGGPVLWFNFGAVAVANQCFALQPGGSLVIAEPKSCPKEAIYTAFSGAGTGIAAIYQNSDPELCQQASQPLQTLSEDVGAVAWGYAPPPPPPSPAPASFSGVLMTSL